MRLIIEMDGPIVDVEPRIWEAYSKAAAESALPRLDRAEFWRRFRVGDPPGRWVPSSPPAKLPAFLRRFEAWLETDELLELQAGHPGIAPTLTGLKRQAELVLITVGPNKPARQKVLDRDRLSEFFSRMLGLSDQPHQRPGQLRELFFMEGKTLVCAASPAVVHAASEAQLPAIGIGHGAATPKRLTQAGAGATFLTLADFEEDLESGGVLTSAGMLNKPARSAPNPFARRRDE